MTAYVYICYIRYIYSRAGPTRELRIESERQERLANVDRKLVENCDGRIAPDSEFYGLSHSKHRVSSRRELTDGAR